MNELLHKLNLQFNNPELLQRALTHKSFHYETNAQSSGHNEKLEFLGDAVLDLVLSEYLMELFPEDNEGGLSKKRASLVNETILARVAGGLELAKFLALGKGEIVSGGEKKPRLLSSAYEAILGAIYLDQGLQKTKEIVRQHFAEELAKIDPKEGFVADYKTRLQEVIQAERKISPQYKVIQESGPAHERQFHVHLFIEQALLAEGQGKSKKNAEQDAAKNALQLLKNQGRIS